MAKNQQFLEALRDLPVATNPQDKVKQLAALDALINVVGADATAFRAAAVAHKGVFASSVDLFTGVDLAADAFLTPGDDNGLNNLRQLQRVAAQKRIEFALAPMPVATKLSIVNEVNDVPLRTQLSGTAYVNLAAPNIAAWTGTLDDPATLTEAMLDEIRTKIRTDLTTPIVNDANSIAVMFRKKQLEAEADIAKILGADAAITPDETASVKKALANILVLQGKREELTKHLAKLDNVNVLDAEGNNAQQGAMVNLGVDLDGLLEESTDALQENLPRLKELVRLNAASVRTKLDEGAPIPPPSVPNTTAQLIVLEEASKKSFEAFTDAFKLLELAAVPDADEKELQKDTQINLLQLQMAMYDSMIADQEAVVKTGIEAIINDPDKQADNKFNFNKAQKGLNELKKAKNAASKMVNTPLDPPLDVAEKDQLKAWLASLSTRYETAKINIEPKRRAYAEEANFFMELSGSTEHFRDELIRAGEREADEDYKADVKTVRDSSKTSVGLEGSVPVRFKAVLLNPDDKIRSTANFPQAKGPALNCIIEQDHTGRVTDMTPPAVAVKLDESQQRETATIMAKKILLNYTSGNNHAIVYGKDEKAVLRVYAALLMLKAGDSKYKKLKVDIAELSIRAKIPQKGLFTLTSTHHKNLVEEHLQESGKLSPHSRVQKQEIKDFAKGTAEAREALAKIKKDPFNQKLSEKTIKEGEELTGHGKRRNP